MNKKIVFIMSYPWFSLYQRPNHFARLFKKSGYSVEVIEMRHIVRLNSLLNRMKFEQHRGDIDRLRSVVKLPLIGLENAQLVRKVRKILASNKADTECLFWFQGFDDSIDYGRILAMLPGKAVLDVSDSFPDFFSDARRRQRLEAAEKTVAEKADAVLTSAGVLYDKFIKFNPKTFLIRNAVDFSIYRKTPHAPPEGIARKIGAMGSAKVVGFQGGIGSWFDFDLMDSVIQDCPGLSFLIVGMLDVRARKDFERLRRHRNFHYIGVVDPDVLPWVLSRIDVGIIPFKMNDLVKAVNPLKLYEYLAAAKPVVATPMPEVMRYEAKGVVATAGGAVSFSKALREMTALPEGPAAVEKRLQIARENSWEARFEQLMECVPGLRNIDRRDHRASGT
ncbi:MAG: glycosyltransferase [Nitrospirae bacterium]|nr:glycosyltransferase [Nitrospirota bacterium]